MEIILVSVGNFQEYILDNITNLQSLGIPKITVITNKGFFQYFDQIEEINLIAAEDLNDYNFSVISRLDKNFRNGFWHYCSLRLFYICSYMDKYQLTNCLHLENDVQIYYNPVNLNFNSTKLCCVFDAYHRVIPSIIFIPNASVFKDILKYYNPLLNDMENLARFGEDIIERLPIFLEDNTTDQHKMVTKNYGKYQMIFDGAAIGQYLGGVDPRNINGDSRGFVNETTIIKYDKYTFQWQLDKETNLYKPYVLVNNIAYPIFNLHIHSKQLHKFMAKKPLEDKFISIIN